MFQKKPVLTAEDYQAKMQYWIKQFNNWRASYDKLTWEDHQVFYNAIANVFPAQIQFNLLAVNDFLKKIPVEPLFVLELGGWQGELAEFIFWSHIGAKIGKWLNYEICPAAYSRRVCFHPAYHHLIAPKPLWELELKQKDEWQVFIASHVLEHMRDHEVAKVIHYLSELPNLDFLYLDVPILEDTLRRYHWNDYLGTHILEISWFHLNDLLEQHGYVLQEQVTQHIRTYERL